jgi:hypothetical protein
MHSVLLLDVKLLAAARDLDTLRAFAGLLHVGVQFVFQDRSNDLDGGRKVLSAPRKQLRLVCNHNAARLSADAYGPTRKMNAASIAVLLGQLLPRPNFQLVLEAKEQETLARFRSPQFRVTPLLNARAMCSLFVDLPHHPRRARFIADVKSIINLGHDERNFVLFQIS